MSEAKVPMTDLYARYTRLKFDRPHQKVLRITMENGRMNTTDEALHRELAEIWRDVDRDASVNAAIITGAGRIFSAGGDFSIIRQNIEDFEARARQWKEARDIVYNVINCSKSPPATMRRSSGRCSVGWPRPNIICCCAKRCWAKRLSASG